MYFALEYDYFLKDHLGNIRTVITEGKDTAVYVATMEPAYQTTEQALFDNEYDPVNTIVAKPSGFDNTGTNTKVVRLNSSTGVAKPNGPGLLLKVMAGDKIQLSVYAWYSGTVQGPGGVNPFNDLLSAITRSVIGGSSGKLSSTINTSVSNAISPNLTTFINGRNYNSTRPKAHLNWILLDEQLNYVQQGGNAVQVPTVSAGAQKQAIAPMLQTMSKSGYLYVYLSNESQMDVYFDDLTVTHYSSALVSEESYYPFGGDMAALKSNAAMKTVNRYKFNAGTELNESFDIDYYETYFRNYDAQVGRFTGVDGMAENFYSLTPYRFGMNDPISFNDPSGALEGLALQTWNAIVAHVNNGGNIQDIYVNGDQVDYLSLSGGDVNGGNSDIPDYYNAENPVFNLSTLSPAEAARFIDLKTKMSSVSSGRWLMQQLNTCGQTINVTNEKPSRLSALVQYDATGNKLKFGDKLGGEYADSYILDAMSHELFHAYQDFSNIPSGTSREVEAFLFEAIFDIQNGFDRQFYDMTVDNPTTPDQIKFKDAFNGFLNTWSFEDHNNVFKYFFTGTIFTSYKDDDGTNSNPSKGGYLLYGCLYSMLGNIIKYGNFIF